MTALVQEKPSLSPLLLLDALDEDHRVLEVLKKFDGPEEEKLEEIDFWRRRIPWFREEYDVKTAPKRSATRVALRTLYDFLHHYRDTGKRLEACRKAGVSWPTIRRRLTKGDKFFLADFYHAYVAVEDEIRADLMDSMYEKAKYGDDYNPGDQKAAKYVIDKLDRQEITEKQEKPNIRPVNVLIHNVTKSAKLTGEVVVVE